MHLTLTVGLQNKDLTRVGSCREVCSSVVGLLFSPSALLRRLAYHHYQYSSRAFAHQKKNESHVSEEEIKAKQHAQHQAKASAKYGAYRDEDGPEEANRWAQSAAIHAYTLRRRRLTHQQHCPLA